MILLIYTISEGIYFCNIKNLKSDYIIWNGDRYDIADDGNLYKEPDLNDVMKSDDNCNVKDIWETVKYYVSAGNEEEVSRLNDLKSIYNEKGAAATIENILTKTDHTNADTNIEKMGYLIVVGLLAQSREDYIELLNTVLNHCFDRDVGTKVYKKNANTERILLALRRLNEHIATGSQKDERDERLSEYRKHIIQLIQLFSTLSVYENRVVLSKPYFDKTVTKTTYSNESRIIQASIDEEGNILLSYTRYKDVFKIGNFTIFGRQKRLNLLISYPAQGQAAKKEIFADSDILKLFKTSDEIILLGATADIFNLYYVSSRIYEPQNKRNDSYSYSLYEVYRADRNTGETTGGCIENFNENFSEDGAYEKYAKDIGYDDSNPLTEENFIYRIYEMMDLWQSIAVRNSIDTESATERIE